MNNTCIEIKKILEVFYLYSLVHRLFCGCCVKPLPTSNAKTLNINKLVFYIRCGFQACHSLFQLKVQFSSAEFFKLVCAGLASFVWVCAGVYHLCACLCCLLFLLTATVAAGLSSSVLV